MCGQQRTTVKLVDSHIYSTLIRRAQRVYNWLDLNLIFILKVFNLSQSLNSPTHHYVLPGGKVRDVTFINDGKDLRIAVMSSHGHIYTEIMNNASCAAEGPFFLTNVIAVSHTTLKDSNGQIAGGGVSLYYSHVLKLMFFSYVQGTIPSSNIFISEGLMNHSLFYIPQCIRSEVEIFFSFLGT